MYFSASSGYRRRVGARWVAIHNPKAGRGIYGLLGLAAVGTGAFIAGRHVYRRLTSR